jgi:ubiquinone/menaquinone biosynthesis C-methylase UbiE
MATVSDTDRVFAGSIPQLYERFMVPMIFEPYAADMARDVVACKPRKVLELAAGTGVVTRRLARELPAGVEIVATDLNQAMLDEAARAGTARPVQWRQADAMKLPFEDASFDVVACQFGAMFFPDKAKAYAEARRVLRPGGELRVFEHVIADHAVGRAVLRGAQATFWPRLCGNCHPARDTSAAIRAAGFETEPLRRFTLRPGGLSPPMPVIVGRAPIAGRPSA